MIKYVVNVGEYTPYMDLMGSNYRVSGHPTNPTNSSIEEMKKCELKAI